jgi:hypothetical protein
MSISYHSKKLAAAFVALASLSLSPAVFAQTNQSDSLVLTELSDHTLTYSLNGSAPTSVNSAGGDDWLFTIPLVVTSPFAPAGYGGYVADWQDHLVPGLFNYVGYNAPGTAGDATINVFSDYGYDDGGTIPVVPNGSTYLYTVGESVGSLSLNVTFNDDRGTSSVPDGGNAALLLALTATALGVVKRAQGKLV